MTQEGSPEWGMPRFRDRLPQLAGGVFLTDSGLETDLIFHHGYDLPFFAAFVLLEDEAGTEVLRRYYREQAAVAVEAGAGFVLEAATWRASPDWARQMGWTDERLAAVNRRAVDLLVEIRDELPVDVGPVVVSGCVGPRGDGYRATDLMTADQARAYHATQIGTFAADTEADMVTAMTLTYPAEAVGVARAAAEAGIPSVISFTVEVDGRLPDGTALGDAVAAVDGETGGAPAYYMVNCAHPDHFGPALEPGAAWTDRVRGVRANASRRSHAELDEAEELDEGDPAELGTQYAGLRERVPGLAVLGGCCGTDVRHVREIASACLAGAGGGR